MILLVDGVAGIYVPQRFAKMYTENVGVQWMKGADPKDIEVLMKGPDHAEYWDAWEDVVQDTTVIIEGEEFNLWEDGDLWAIREEEQAFEEEQEKERQKTEEYKTWKRCQD